MKKFQEIIKPLKEEEYGAAQEAEELIEIVEQMTELMHQAESVIREGARKIGNSRLYDNFRSYAYGHIMSALGTGDYGSSGGMDTMAEIANAFEEESYGGGRDEDEDY